MSATKMVISLVGDKRLLKKLEALGEKGAKKVAAAALRKGLTVEVKAIRNAVPAATTPGHSSKSIKRSIGSRFGKAKSGSARGMIQAKAGIDVGMTKARAKYLSDKYGAKAPHAHLIALGTVNRWTGTKILRRKGGNRVVKTGHTMAFRGRVVGNAFVKRGAASAQGPAMARIKSALAEGIAKEAAK